MRSSSEWLTAWLAAVLPEIYTGMKIPTNPATGSQPILGANRPSTKHLSAATVSTTNSMHALRRNPGLVNPWIATAFGLAMTIRVKGPCVPSPGIRAARNDELLSR